MRDRLKYEKRIGTVIDARWRIDRLLGWGSTSAVYAATHRNGHVAALKIVHASLCGNATLIERFLREAGLANAIKHRAVVPIRDDGKTEEGCPYLVLELLEGETLDLMQARGKGRITLEEFAPIAEELMSAISAVHAAGVVHRDLKPQNVFITTSGELKLLDFGTARILDGEVESKLSMQGLVLGTPAFMSPEQARGSRSEVDAQSDVWSLGAMIFTLLSGEFVHAGEDAHRRLLAAASKPARELQVVAPSIDDRVASVVDCALRFAKSERWPDVRSMRLAFRHAIVASMPTMRDLKAFADVRGESPSLMPPAPAGSVDGATEAALASGEGEGARVADAGPLAARDPATSHPSSAREPSRERSRPARGRPTLALSKAALVVGLAAMASASLVVLFFTRGDDVAAGASAATSAFATGHAPAAVVDLAERSPSVADPRRDTTPIPASSYLVIEAPDEPAAKKRVAVAAPPRTWAWTNPRTRYGGSIPPATNPEATSTPDEAIPDAAASPPEPDVTKESTAPESRASSASGRRPVAAESGGQNQAGNSAQNGPLDVR